MAQWPMAPRRPLIRAPAVPRRWLWSVRALQKGAVLARGVSFGARRAPWLTFDAVLAFGTGGKRAKMEQVGPCARRACRRFVRLKDGTVSVTAKRTTSGCIEITIAEDVQPEHTPPAGTFPLVSANVPSRMAVSNYYEHIPSSSRGLAMGVDAKSLKKYHGTPRNRSRASWSTSHIPSHIPPRAEI